MRKFYFFFCDANLEQPWKLLVTTSRTYLFFTVNDEMQGPRMAVSSFAPNDTGQLVRWSYSQDVSLPTDDLGMRLGGDVCFECSPCSRHSCTNIINSVYKRDSYHKFCVTEEVSHN